MTTTIFQQANSDHYLIFISNILKLKEDIQSEFPFCKLKIDVD